MGAVLLQPLAFAKGGVEVVVIRYPATATLSEAVKAVIGISRLVDVEEAVNALTVGEMMSGGPNFITVALLLLATSRYAT